MKNFFGEEFVEECFCKDFIIDRFSYFPKNDKKVTMLFFYQNVAL